jgi:hypothetical protein
MRWTPAVLLAGLAALCGVALAGTNDRSAMAHRAPLRAFTAGPLERIRPADAHRIASGVARGWNSWSRDPAVLERARLRIAALLDRR